VIGYIPSPPSNNITLGPFELHFYGLIIAAAVLVAAWVAQHRWARLGGLPATILPIAFWAVLAGLIGARLYSVATSWQQDTQGRPVQILEVWNGGLGIWGGIAGGVLGGWLRARRMRLPLAPLLDVVAPTLALAQAIGRWGNYFNQELFGLPSRLPWAVRITNQAQLAAISPAKYRTAVTAAGTYLPGTFQPTFLYECLWDLATFGLVLLVERKVRLRRGSLFWTYAALYTFGRFFTEYLRIDPAHRFLGLRLNDWTSIAVFVVAATTLLLRGRPKPDDELVGQPLPAGALAMERSRSGLTAPTGPSTELGPVAAEASPEATAEPEAEPGAGPEPVVAEAAPEPEAEAVAAAAEAPAEEPSPEEPAVSPKPEAEAVADVGDGEEPAADAKAGAEPTATEVGDPDGG
jgi:prolipoprotein diacylglyceryl transferase